MKGMQHHIQIFNVEMESCKIFWQGCPGTMIFPISAIQVAEIIDVSH
jgi:hypothetical protein